MRILGTICTASLCSIAAADTGDLVRVLAEKSNAFIESLDASQSELLLHPFEGDERLNWHFIPRNRQGLPFAALDDRQEALALEVLQAALSAAGFDKVSTIRQLEAVLRDDMGQSPAFRDPDKYFFTVFGTPSAGGTWGLRYEGHHISLNWTIVDGKAFASTPQFLGANPGEVRVGSMKGTRVLKAEEDLARALVTSLSAEQRAAAIVGDTAPRDILTANSKTAEPQGDGGIGYAQLTPEQQGQLIQIIEEGAQVQNPVEATARLKSIREAGMDKLKFAWMGGVEPGEGHYYRIQGPTFIFEYDNTQNNANHIHTAWRDFDGDFGRDLLREHYEAHDHGQAPPRLRGLARTTATAR